MNETTEKTVVVIYKGDDWDKQLPLEKAPETRKSFEEIYTSARKFGVTFYRASIAWFDQETLSFCQAWTYTNGQWIKVSRPIIPNVIFDKIAGKYDYSLYDQKIEMARTIKFFNHPLFRTIFDNKLTQYTVFSAFMPQTYLIATPTELDKIASVTSERVVMKPLYGSGGVGVCIKDKSDFSTHHDMQMPFIIQEFIPTQGIPAVSHDHSIADLRIVFINHEPIYALSRIAREDSLLTNFHQGAHATMIPLEKIPQSCSTLCSEIVRSLKIFTNAHYSLDFMFDLSGKPYLIEMNTTPGFDLLYLIGDEKLKELHTKKLLSAFFPSIV